MLLAKLTSRRSHAPGGRHLLKRGSTDCRWRLCPKRTRRRAWIRAVVGTEEDGLAPLWYGQIIVGPKPDGWEPRDWVYPDCRFVGVDLAARRLSSVFMKDAGDAAFDFGAVRATFMSQETVSWQRLASRHLYSGVELPWPTRHCSLYMPNTLLSQPSSYMVGSAGPSFPTFAGAYSAFFHDEWRQTGAGSPTLGQILIVMVDQRARLSRVVAHAASVDVWVSGRSVKGSRLELNSSTDRVEMQLARGGKVSIPLGQGLGQDAWLWLKDDEGWLDFRSITPWGGRSSPDVEVEVSDDPVADITALAAQGESSYLEYKATLPDSAVERKRTVLKTVVAFANGEGGTVLFGVEGDDDVGKVVGLDGRPGDLMRQVNDLIRDRISPPPTVDITGHQVDKKYVIRLDVSPGGGSLFALVLDANRPEYYVRRNGSTFYARPDELAAIVSSRVMQPAPGSIRGRFM